MDEVEFHAPPRESKSKRWLSFHPFSGLLWLYGYIYIYILVHLIVSICFVGVFARLLHSTSQVDKTSEQVCVVYVMYVLYVMYVM